MYITFIHHKGGSGKTTSCINVAGHLALWGKRVLVLDLDSQGNATSGLGIDRSMVQNKKKSIKETILETRSGVHIAQPLNDFDLNQELEDIWDHYDYILIDPPPGEMPEMPLIDSAIVPLDGLFALESLDLLSKTIQEFEGKIKKRIAVFNKVKLMGNWSAGVKVEGFEKVFAIPYSNKVYASQVMGMPLSHLAPNSRASKAYEKLAHEVLI